MFTPGYSSTPSPSSSSASTSSPSALQPSTEPFGSAANMFPSQRGGAAAPLPSPTSRNDGNDYFSTHQSMMAQVMRQQGQRQQQSGEPHRYTQPQSQYLSSQQAQLSLQQQQQQQQRHQQQLGGLTNSFQPQTAAHQQQHQQQQSRQNSDSSTSSGETNMHLHNFTLLAEAAERAKIGCTVRDLEEMTLG